MAEISQHFKSPQKEVSALVKSGQLKKQIYCYGSGGFDGFGTVWGLGLIGSSRARQKGLPEYCPR
jgi:hypothetical protein